VEEANQKLRISEEAIGEVEARPHLAHVRTTLMQLK
jgi:hypothetical protein